MVMETNYPGGMGGAVTQTALPPVTDVYTMGAETAGAPVTDTGAECPQGQSWDIATGACVPSGGGQCPTGQIWNAQIGMCEFDPNAPQTGECPPGQEWSAMWQRCRNSAGGDPPDGMQCPDGQAWNSIHQQCMGELTNQPPTTDTLPDAGQCPQGQIWDYFTSTCKQAPDVGTGGGTDPYDTTLPPVDPYDVSDSRDWMNIFDYGGENSNVNAINPQARDMDYGQINNFSDAAWQNSMRHLQPQMDLQDDRFAQELINKGIDPNSEAGQKAFRQKSMGQNDMLSKSAFDAMGFGTDIQNQMFGQDAVRSQLANAMLQSQMGLSQRGHEFDTTAEMQANEQAFMQMMGLEGLNYRDYLTGVDQGRYQDSLALALAGLAPAPTFNTSNTGLSQYPGLQYGQETNYFQDLYRGG